MSPYKNPWAVLWWKVTSGTGETFPAFGIYSDTLVPRGSMSQLRDNFSWSAQGVKYPLVTVVESVIQLFFWSFFFYDFLLSETAHVYPLCDGEWFISGNVTGCFFDLCIYLPVKYFFFLLFLGSLISPPLHFSLCFTGGNCSNCLAVSIKTVFKLN